MELTLAPNPLYSEPQTLQFEKIATLIGENGSGKSTILHSVFNSRVTESEVEYGRLICFTSGQNESFSEIFSQRIDRIRRDNTNSDIDFGCLYFTKRDVRLLVFLSSTFVPEGKVRSFLKDSGYIEIHDDLDQTSVFSIPLNIPKAYLKRVKKDAEAEILDFNHVSIRRRPFNQRLELFVEKATNLGDFEALIEDGMGIQNQSISVSSVDYFNCFDGSKLDAAKFLIEGSYNDYFLDASGAQLEFGNNLEFGKLSDGEYQLLFLYALIDLFDDENTLFLLDEADSHLHYKNIEHLWQMLEQLDGRAITTTHLLDSITANDFHAIKVVEQGRICEEDKLKQLINRLSILSRATSVEYEVCAKIPHMALLDDYNDWEIFLRLAKRKGLDIDKLRGIHSIKKSSGFSSISEAIGESKLLWTEKLSVIDSIFCTTHIFLICDRDELPLKDINKTNGVLVNGAEHKKRIRSIKWPKGKKVEVFLLAWKRREIKSYLLSFTALTHHGALAEINSDTLAVASHLKYADPGDNEGIRKLDVKEVVNPFINRDGYGLCSEKLQAYIELIPPEEISEDIENMYNFIEGKL